MMDEMTRFKSWIHQEKSSVTQNQLHANTKVHWNPTHNYIDHTRHCKLVLKNVKSNYFFFVICFKQEFAFKLIISAVIEGIILICVYSYNYDSDGVWPLQRDITSCIVLPIIILYLSWIVFVSSAIIRAARNDQLSRSSMDFMVGTSVISWSLNEKSLNAW